MLRSTLSHLTLVPDVDAPRPLEKGATETLWARLRHEAQQAVAREPMLAPLLFNSILNQPSFEAAIFHRIASRLGNDVVRPSVIADVFRRASSADPEIGCAVRADIAAVVDRDPACDRFIEPFLYFKEEGGYWAEVPAIAGCATQGETFEELLQNLYEAIEGCLAVDVQPPESEDGGRILEIAV